jgi:hypothetical protein
LTYSSRRSIAPTNSERVIDPLCRVVEKIFLALAYSDAGFAQLVQAPMLVMEPSTTMKSLSALFEGVPIVLTGRVKDGHLLGDTVRTL